MLSPFFIVGPTAVGKTGIAAAVAERCGAEIINADAFQVYEDLELLSAKPSPQERQRVPHHLFGHVPLAESYNVAQYEREARCCMEDVSGRRKCPVIVVGGSGMYVKALTHGLSPLPAAQQELRTELDALGLEVLRQRLNELDPAAMGMVDLKNKRRVVRAIEICMATGRPFSELREKWKVSPAPQTAAGVFLVRGKDEMKARIAARVKSMFARGVIDEVRAIAPSLISETASCMIGWKEIRAYLRDESSLTECMEKIASATRQYAKRQMTWFRGEAVFEEIMLPVTDDGTSTVDYISQRVLEGNP